MVQSLITKQGTWFWLNFYHIASHYFKNIPCRAFYHMGTRNFHIFDIFEKLLLKVSVAPFNQRIDFSVFLYTLLFLGRQITIFVVSESGNILSVGLYPHDSASQEWPSQVPLRQLASQLYDRSLLDSLWEWFILWAHGLPEANIKLFHCFVLPMRICHSIWLLWQFLFLFNLAHPWDGPLEYTSSAFQC